MNNINIIKTKENNIEFDMKIDGIDKSNEEVFFVIETKCLNISIPCQKDSDDKWVVKIPILDFLDAAIYSFHIQVVIDGFYFKPFSGTLNILNNVELYVKKVENKTTKSTIVNNETEKHKSGEIQKETKPVINSVKTVTNDVNDDSMEVTSSENDEEDAKPNNLEKSEIVKISDNIVGSVKNNNKPKVIPPPIKNNSVMDAKIKSIINDVSKIKNPVKYKKGTITGF